MDPVAVILLVLACAVALRLLAGNLDHTRIRHYVEERGGRVRAIHWAPFGRGWFGERGDRIYEIDYLDANGLVHHASCKTSLLSGVYWTEDDAVAPVHPLEASAPAPPSDLERLRAENRQLKDELARLKDRLDP